MTTLSEEIFDVTRNERLSLITGAKGSSKIRQFENQSGARIRVANEPTFTTVRIFGNSSQRGEAKVLIRDILEKTSFIPTISYFVLAESGLNNNRLKFVESDEESGGRTRYLVKFSENDESNETYDEINIEDFLHITPRQFNTFDKIDDCLDILSSKLKSNFRQNSTTPKNSLFSEQIILKPRIFFGKVLFSEIDNPENSFTLGEWYKFSVSSGRGRRGSGGGSGEENVNRNGKSVNVEFQQDSPQIYNDFKILQQKFGFKVHNKRAYKNKGSIYIYYTPSSTNKKRKLKLRWNENERRWKIANHSHNINRLANFDIVSGSKAPDFRLSLKTHYDISSEGSKIEEVINEIQFSRPSSEDENQFKSSDFNDTLIQRAVIRQVIDKKRFRNDDYHITFSTIRHCDVNDRVTTQKLITLKHHTWAQDVTLDNIEGFMNNVVDTINYVQEMMTALV